MNALLVDLKCFPLVFGLVLLCWGALPACFPAAEETKRISLEGLESIQNLMKDKQPLKLAADICLEEDSLNSQ